MESAFCMVIVEGQSLGFFLLPDLSGLANRCEPNGLAVQASEQQSLALSTTIMKTLTMPGHC